MCHDDESVGQLRQAAKNAALIGIGIAQDRVRRGHDRHAQIGQEVQNVAARRSAKNAVFMLHTYQIDIVGIEEIRGATVAREVVLL